MTRADRRLVVGVGNLDRGDDAAGRLVARRLADRNPCAVEVRECRGEATALMDAWTGFDDVVLVDACRGAGEPGTRHRFAADDLELLARLRPRPDRSTHALGVPAALGLASALGTLPSRLVIYAIEGRDFGDGAGVTREVERAVEELVALLVHDFGEEARTTSKSAR